MQLRFRASRQTAQTICQLRAAFSTVRKFADEQREWLRVSRDSQRARINGIKTTVANQSSGGRLGAFVIAAVNEAGPHLLFSCFKHRQKHFAWDRLESGDYMSPRILFCKLFSARRSGR